VILILTNLKSDGQGILDIRTFYGTNDIKITTTTENDDYIKKVVGEIKMKEEIQLYELQEEDLNASGRKLVNAVKDKYFDSDKGECDIISAEHLNI